MPNKVLIIDSDSRLLETCKQQLQKRFPLFTALSSEQAIELALDEGPFAVIATNLNLSGTKGANFLSELKKLSPDSLYIILVGDKNLQPVAKVLDNVGISRLLPKPCEPKKLAETIEISLREYQFRKTEQEKLEETLRGSVEVLCEILSLVSPKVFSQAMRIKNYVGHIAKQLELPELWQYEAAAMLCQIGCVTMPPDLLGKVYGKEELTLSEKKMFASHPSVGCKLLSHIPGLEKIARMIEDQMRPFRDYPSLEKLANKDRIIATGAQMLKVATYFGQLGGQEIFHQAILNALCKTDGEFNPKMLTAFAGFVFDKVETEVRTLTVKDLEIGMVTDEDIKSQKGILLLPKGVEVTYTALERLRNFSQDGSGVKEPFWVRIPSASYQTSQVK